MSDPERSICPILKEEEKHDDDNNNDYASLK